MDYKKLKEEPLKSAVQQDFFNTYKYTQLGNIDFVVAKNIVDKGQTSLFDEFENDELKSLLWAEAKQGTSHDIFESFVQLILTIGKERTFEKYLPPKYIGAFDAEKFAFIEYHQIQHIFYQNDFNWNVTPSNHDTKEFRQLHALCQSLLEESSILFHFETQANEFKEFIRLNFKTGKEDAIADASFYDIRQHFQGTNDKGTMNTKSDDATYTSLIATLREKMKLLAKRIEPKVYEYGFLK